MQSQQSGPAPRDFVNREIRRTIILRPTVLQRSPISSNASERVSEPRSSSFLTRYSADLSAQYNIIDQYTGVDG
jgi:hypothetical protein